MPVYKAAKSSGDSARGLFSLRLYLLTMGARLFAVKPPPIFGSVPERQAAVLSKQVDVTLKCI